MKRFIRPDFLPYASHLAGIVGLLLCWWQYATGIDKKGLFISAHPAGILLWILSAVFLVYLFLCVQPLTAKKSFHKHYPASPVSFVGCLFAALGAFCTAVQLVVEKVSILHILTAISALIASGSFLLTAICRKQGKTPNYLLSVATVLFFFLLLFCRSQTWGKEAQFYSFGFTMFALICVLLSSYYRTALNILGGNLRKVVFFSQAALFFCYLSIPQGNLLFYIPMMLWLSADMPVLHPLREVPHTCIKEKE